MSLFNKLALLCCLLQPSSQTLFINFHSVPSCRNITGVWCVQAFVLRSMPLAYASEAVSGRNCFPGPYSPIFDWVENPSGANEWNVGFRHNCTNDGSMRDYLAKVQFVKIEYHKQLNITTEVDIDNAGMVVKKESWDGYRFVDWEVIHY